jgi:hypothetical protein
MAPTKSAPQRISTEVLNAYIASLKEDFVGMREQLASIVESLQVLARVEQRQLTMIAELSKKDDNDRDIERRISVIEQVMPGLKELRAWVVGGMVTGVTMMLISVASLVLYPRPVAGTFVLQPSSAIVQPAAPQN